MPSFLKPAGSDVEVRVKVVPGASRDRIVGPLGDALKVQVAAPAEKGRANAAVLALLAKRLGVPAARLSVLSGPTSAHKRLLVRGVSVEQAARALGLT